MWSLNLGRPAIIPQLNEKMAIELGAKLLGELLLFAIPAVLIVLEYIRYKLKKRSNYGWGDSITFFQTFSQGEKENRGNSTRKIEAC